MLIIDALSFYLVDTFVICISCIFYIWNMKWMLRIYN